MRKALILVVLCACAIVTVLATSTRTIVDTDAVRIEQEGLCFAVHDLLGGRTYSLHRRRREGQTTPTVLVLTDTIKIERVKMGFKVVSNGKVYQITRKKGGVLIWQRRYQMKNSWR